MPAGVAAGDTVLVLLNKNDPGTGTLQPEWTSRAADTSQNERYEVLTAIADGAWTGNRLTRALAGARAGSSITYVFRDVGPSGVEMSAINVQGAAQPNPPSLAPSWGAADTYWIAGAAWSVNATTVSSYPASYTGGVEAAPTSGLSHQASARRQLNAASDDPAAFALSGTLTGIYSITLAVQGIAPPPATRTQVVIA
jgi:hypothetical protein